MNKWRQGAMFQEIVMDLIQRYLNRQDLPVTLRVERLDDEALLVTHTTGVCVRIRIQDTVTADQVAAVRDRLPYGPPPDSVNPTS